MHKNIQTTWVIVVQLMDQIKNEVPFSSIRFLEIMTRDFCITGPSICAIILEKTLYAVIEATNPKKHARLCMHEYM